MRKAPELVIKAAVSIMCASLRGPGGGGEGRSQGGGVGCRQHYVHKALAGTSNHSFANLRFAGPTMTI